MNSSRGKDQIGRNPKIFLYLRGELRLGITIKIIVFDFDGTLVDSNQLKYDAFFKLFPNDGRHFRTVREVLAEIGEDSRYHILEEILKRLDGRQSSDLRRKVNELAAKYNDMTMEGAKKCPEIPGAGNTLKLLAEKYRLYVSSATPENSVREIVHARGWHRYFVDIFGYPRKKVDTLKEIIKRENVRCSEVLVVGDGRSDKKSARENGCPFVQVNEEFHFGQLHGIIARLQSSDADIRKKMNEA